MEHIKKSHPEPWDRNLAELQAKKVDPRIIAKASEKLPEMEKNRSRLSKENTENAFESIICKSTFSTGRTINMSFIPASNQSDSKLRIHSSLEPVKVVQEGRVRHYSKKELVIAMNKASLEVIQQNQGERYKMANEGKDLDGKPSNVVSRMENILLGLNPITVRPAGSKKDSYLGEHLPHEKNSFKGNGEIVIGKTNVTGNLDYANTQYRNLNLKDKIPYQKGEEVPNIRPTGQRSQKRDGTKIRTPDVGIGLER